jgi:hypothetical protein
MIESIFSGLLSLLERAKDSFEMHWSSVRRRVSHPLYGDGGCPISENRHSERSDHACRISKCCLLGEYLNIAGGSELRPGGGNLSIAGNDDNASAVFHAVLDLYLPGPSQDDQLW